MAVHQSLKNIPGSLLNNAGGSISAGFEGGSDEFGFGGVNLGNIYAAGSGKQDNTMVYVFVAIVAVYFLTKRR